MVGNVSASRILIRATNWLGDGVLSYPTVAFLRQTQATAHLTLAARPGVADLFRHCPLLDDVLVVPRSTGVRRWADPLLEARLIRRGRFSEAYILPNSFAAALPAALAGIPRRVGYATDARKALLTEARPVTPDVLGIHQVHYYLALAGHPPTAEIPVEPRVHLLESEHAWAQAHLANLGVEPDRPFLALVPGAAYGTAKRWIPERFTEIGRRTVAQLGWPVVLFGSAVEQLVAETIAAEIGGRAISLAGRTDVRQAAALLARARICLTNDTGLMHVAAAVGTRVLAVFGATDIVTTPPRGQGHVIVREPVDCSPCLLRHCPIDHRCMERISVDRVWSALSTMAEDGQTNRGRV